MTNIAKKAAKYTPTRMASDALGLGRSNSLRRLADPLEEARRVHSEEGSGALKQKLKAGDITDPGGLLHKINPDTTVDPAPAAPNLGDATANVDTRRSRRRRGVLANLFGFGSLGQSNVGRATLG